MKRFIITGFTIWILLACTSIAAADEESAVDLGPIVITASRIAQHDYKVAGNVTVINSEDIEASNARTIPEILQLQPGVNIYDTGTTKTATVDIRGFGDTAARNVLILVNDRKVNSIDISGPDLMQIPLEAVEQIEIVRGASSVLYGDNAVGGVVNIITKQGKGSLSGQVGAAYGSYRTSGANMEVTGSRKFEMTGLDNEISYYLYSKYYYTDGYRDNSDLLSKDYNGHFGYKLSDRASVDLRMGWHRDDYGLPGGLDTDELASLGRRGSADSNDFASSKDKFVQLAFDIKPYPDDIELGHLALDFSYRKRDTYGSFAAFDFNSKRAIDSYGLTSKYIFDKELFDKEFNFVAGLDYYDTDNGILGSGSNTDDLTISKEEFGGYLFAEYEAFDDFFASAGTRFQQADYTFDQRAATVSYDSTKPQESVSSFGMKYEYAPGSNMFFDVQQTFRFLATDEWYDSFTATLNRDLEQQTGMQYEAGLKHNYKNASVLTATVYQLDLKNEIFYDPKGGPGGWGANSNYDTTRRFGFEAGQTTNVLRFLDTEMFNTLEFSTNYAYQDPEFVDGVNDGKLIPLAAQHQANIGCNLELYNNLGFSIQGRYVSSRYPINDTENITVPLKPYFVVDSKFSYKRRHLEFFVAINNMFNEKYYSYAAKKSGSLDKDHYPAAERNILIGVTGKF
ncbi:TonB-dependent receptor [Candidatus Omnitrophota bacterium]